MTHTKEWYKEWKAPNLTNGFNERGYWIDHVEGLKMGFGVDLSKLVYLNATNGIILEDKVEIGQHCTILSSSTIGGQRDGEVYIGENTQIGSYTLIMPGVRIGKNCIIGAYSYVDKDLPDGTKFIPNKNKYKKDSKSVK